MSSAPSSITSMQVSVAVRGTLLSKKGRKGGFQHVTLSRPYPWPLPPIISDSHRQPSEDAEDDAGEFNYLRLLPTTWEASRLSLHHFRESILLMAELMGQVTLAPEQNSGHIPSIVAYETSTTWPLLVQLLREAATLENQMHANITESTSVATKLDSAVGALNKMSEQLAAIVAVAEGGGEMTPEQVADLQQASVLQDSVEELKSTSLQTKVARIKKQHQVLQNRYCTQIVLMELFAPHVLQRQTWKCLRQTFAERFPAPSSSSAKQSTTEEGSSSVEESDVIVAKAFDNARETFHAFFPLFNRNSTCRPPPPPPPPLGEFAHSEPGAVSQLSRPVLSLFHAPPGAVQKKNINAINASVGDVAAAAFGGEADGAQEEDIDGIDKDITNGEGVTAFVLGHKARIEINIPMDVVEACTVQAQESLPAMEAAPQAGNQEMMTTFKLMEACVTKSRDFSLRDITRRIECVAAVKESMKSGNPVTAASLGYVPQPTSSDIKRFEREQRPASVYNFAKAFNALLKDLAIKKWKMAAAAKSTTTAASSSSSAKKTDVVQELTVEDIAGLMDVSMVRAFVGGIHDRIGKAQADDEADDAAASGGFDGTAALIAELNKQSEDEDDFESVSDSSENNDDDEDPTKPPRRSKKKKQGGRLPDDFDFNSYQQKLKEDIENDKTKSKEEIDAINKQFLIDMREKREKRRAQRELKMRKRKFDPSALTEMRASVAKALDPYGDEKV